MSAGKTYLALLLVGIGLGATLYASFLLAGKGAEKATLDSETGWPAGFWLVLLAGLAWAGYRLGVRMEGRSRA